MAYLHCMCEDLMSISSLACRSKHNSKNSNPSPFHQRKFPSTLNLVQIVEYLIMWYIYFKCVMWLLAVCTVVLLCSLFSIQVGICQMTTITTGKVITISTGKVITTSTGTVISTGKNDHYLH